MKHCNKCENLEQATENGISNGSYCLETIEGFQEPSLITNVIEGNIKTPSWCPLNKKERETNVKEND